MQYFDTSMSCIRYIKYLSTQTFIIFMVKPFKILSNLATTNLFNGSIKKSIIFKEYIGYDIS
jgi:hypothetical protein